MLKKLQRNKAVGLDDMKIEFILDAGELLHMSLLTTFNSFMVESFSLGWSTHCLKGAMPPNLTTTEGQWLNLS